jgi:hypothetical protein
MAIDFQCKLVCHKLASYLHGRIQAEFAVLKSSAGLRNWLSWLADDIGPRCKWQKIWVPCWSVSPPNGTSWSWSTTASVCSILTGSVNVQGTMTLAVLWLEMTECCHRGRALLEMSLRFTPTCIHIGLIKGGHRYATVLSYYCLFLMYWGMPFPFLCSLHNLL